MTKKPTYAELEIERDYYKRNLGSVSVFLIIVLILLLVGLGYYGIRNNQLLKENLALKEQIAELKTPEVISGNLYIGYEDGVRIGYRQGFNGTWYRCAKECEVISP